MDQDLLDVLVIGEKYRCCHLIKALEQLRCRCWFAFTVEEIRANLDRHGCRLVLSTRPVTEGSGLMLLLCEPKRNVFYSIPVENGCLWFRAFPEFVAGERLFAVRAREFKRLLTDLIVRLNPPKRSISIPSSKAVFDGASYARRKARAQQDEYATTQSM